MTWTGISTPVTFNESNTYLLQIYGSVVLDPNVTMNAGLSFRGTAASTLTTNAAGLGNLAIEVIRTGADGGITLVDDLINPNAQIRLTRGKWLMSGRTMDVDFFASNTTGSRTFDMTNDTINVRETFAITGTGRNLV